MYIFMRLPEEEEPDTLITNLCVRTESGTMGTGLKVHLDQTKK